MINYVIFIFVIILLIIMAQITRKKGFEKLAIERVIEKNHNAVESEIKVTLNIKNNKWMPIPFLIIQEIFPQGIVYGKVDAQESNSSFHINSLNISRFQKIKRTYFLRAKKRGVYLLKGIKVSVGDIFGLASESKDIEDYQEIVIYPSIMDFAGMKFNDNSLSGNTIVKRWIYKDPLYIKGIREYSVEDRMKDIHWKSSLKMNKLMVKDYDYTSDSKVTIILNVQCGIPYWSNIDEESIERSVNISAALSKNILDSGIPVGMWTNSRIISYKNDSNNEVKPSAYSLKDILDLCARIGNDTAVDFYDYLKSKSREFSKNCSYIILTSYLSEESINYISKLKLYGFSLYVIDVSENNSVPIIKGIEKLSYGGQDTNEQR
jgi:uncharacterized protein (DUF58 family)